MGMLFLVPLHQWARSKIGPFMHLTPSEETEVKPKPGKHSEIRIKPLPLANGHDRYIIAATHPDGRLRPLGDGRMAVTYSRYKFVTVSLPEQLRNGRFNSETAVRRFQK